MNWTAIGVGLSALALLGGFISWYLFKVRAKVWYNITTIGGHLSSVEDFAARRIEAVRIDIENKSLRHLKGVQFRLRQIRNIETIDMKSASSIDRESFTFVESADSVLITVPDVPAKEKLMIELIHHGWTVLDGKLSGASDAYAFISRSEESSRQLVMGVFFWFLLLVVAILFAIQVFV